MPTPQPQTNWPTSCGCLKAAAPRSKTICVARSGVFWKVTVALMCLGITAIPLAGASTSGPPMPVLKQRPEVLHSPRGKELYSVTAMAIVLPPKSYALTWDYPLPLPRPGVEFDVETRADFSLTWVKLTSTNQPPVPITTGANRMFYRVGAHKP